MNSQDAGGMSLPILHGPARHRDPVCGMMVVPEKAAAKAEHAGMTYYFCSKNCAERFSREPEKFLVAPELREWTTAPRPGNTPQCEVPELWHHALPTKKKFVTPARCIRRSSEWGRGAVRSAAWHLSPWMYSRR